LRDARRVDDRRLDRSLGIGDLPAGRPRIPGGVGGDGGELQRASGGDLWGGTGEAEPENLAAPVASTFDPVAATAVSPVPPPAGTTAHFVPFHNAAYEAVQVPSPQE
jgi:hypothetical protein